MLGQSAPVTVLVSAPEKDPVNLQPVDEIVTLFPRMVPVQAPVKLTETFESVLEVGVGSVPENVPSKLVPVPTALPLTLVPL